MTKLTATIILVSKFEKKKKKGPDLKLWFARPIKWPRQVFSGTRGRAKNTRRKPRPCATPSALAAVVVAGGRPPPLCGRCPTLPPLARQLSACSAPLARRRPTPPR